MSSGIKLYSANLAAIDHFRVMIDGWFDRLKDAVKKQQETGKSLRAISLSAGLNGHYLTHMFRKDTPPTVDNLFCICRAIEADPIEILTGVKQQNPEVGRALQAFSSWPDDQQKRFLDWIESIPAPSGKNDQEKISAPADPAGS